MKRVLDERVELEEKREAAAAKRRAEEAALISGQERKVSLHHFETDSTRGHFSASDEESLRKPILASQRSILILSMYTSKACHLFGRHIQLFRRRKNQRAFLNL